MFCGERKAVLFSNNALCNQTKKHTVLECTWASKQILSPKTLNENQSPVYSQAFNVL